MAVPLPMTAGRWAALAVGTPFALLTIGLAGLSLVAEAGQGSYRVSLTLPTQGRPVSLAVNSGDITAGPVTGSRMLVHGVAHYALVHSDVTWHRTTTDGGAGLAVSSSCHQIIGNCSFDLTVGVPRTPAAVISSGSGNLTARGLAGNITLRSESGDLRASGLAGRVTMTGQSGNVRAAGLTGARVDIQQQSGDITVNDLASPDVTVVDQSGNVVLAFSRVPSRVVVRNQSGDITVVLPPGDVAYRVDASTTSGTTSTQVPTSPVSAHVIMVTNQSGNITIAR